MEVAADDDQLAAEILSIGESTLHRHPSSAFRLKKSQGVARPVKTEPKYRKKLKFEVLSSSKLAETRI